MKFSLKVTAIVLGIFLAACAAMLFLVPAEAQQGKVTGNEYTVVYRLKPQASEGVKPEVRIYVVASGQTEGDAIIASYKFLAEKLTVQATEQLQYLEVQGREKK